MYNLHHEFVDNHNLINLYKYLNGIFIIFSKDHNTLCWVSCLSEIKTRGYFKHFDCETCNIKNIKHEKKEKI